VSAELLIAIVAPVVALATAVTTFALNEYAKRRADWRQKKFEHYQRLLLALSGHVGNRTVAPKIREEFAESFNSIALIASQEVIACLLEFHDEISERNTSPSREQHDRLLTDLLLAIRKDVGLSSKDHGGSFEFRLIGPN
jgi:hypothetical protein